MIPSIGKPSTLPDESSGVPGSVRTPGGSRRSEKKQTVPGPLLNKQRVQKMIEQGRMTEAGLAKIGQYETIVFTIVARVRSRPRGKTDSFFL
jgi:hypothetical protein